MKNRIELAAYFNDQGFETGAEVGVFRGHYSEILCRAIPGLKLYCVDPWTPYDAYRDHRRHRSFSEAERLARETLAPYDVTFIKAFSVTASKEVADGSLDFVYIDGNHQYEFVKEDIEAWAPKVRKGGIVSGDDYYVFDSGNVGVIKAVDEYCADHGIELHIIPEDKVTHIDHDDRQPQWWFVK